MDKRKKIIFFTVLILAVSAMTAYAYVTAPPEVAGHDCDEHETEAASVLEGEIMPVDPASAKYLTVQLSRLDGETGANNIANALAALGSIGKIKCDMTTKQFNVQYDGKALDADRILQTLEKAGYPGTIIQGS